MESVEKTDNRIKLRPRKPVVLPEPKPRKDRNFNIRCTDEEHNDFHREAETLDISATKLITIAFQIFKTMPMDMKIEQYHRVTGKQVIAAYD